jgi:hypothetical protein
VVPVHQRDPLANGRLGGGRLLRNQPRDPTVRLDPPGTVLVVAGLIGIGYGLSRAEIDGWGAPLTIVC